MTSDPLQAEINDFENELRREWEWREDELRSLSNLIGREDDDESKSHRKSIIVMLYAHYEGFAVFALNHYRIFVNRQRLTAQTAASSIVAGAWGHIFKAIQSGDEKCRVFTSELPDDRKLHILWRRRNFIEQHDSLRSREIVVEDAVVDSDSNMKPKVLSRNLFLLGIPHDWVRSVEGEINRLIQIRNALAHGSRKQGIPNAEFDEIEQAMKDVIERIQSEILNSVNRQHFLSSSAL
ncbi:hypothetical protein KOR42_10590 [Thalassoglobus neptunius]|uniref:RiboL-PSP-HEPN domain-containing protein n=1 Tax=Thalassoglobus neptunius TaxID=1938619 RepID=A0A5C5X6D2_9PLAN|nr:MAE_28990/MAE_18760 family HEPN-like nuclease [Thalassoglobus neptunius]TWT57695.1 hypothetical protein KOR42_10590 [Thalassoglobus neptunius]